MLYRIYTIVTISILISSSACASDWSEYKSDHFIVSYHPGIPDSYVREFTRKCEGYYDRITERLGFNRFNFWLWDNRARLYVFKNREEYASRTGAPGWTGAAVHAETKQIATYYMPHSVIGDEGAIGDGSQEEIRAFFDIILPHELTHIIFREFVGHKTRVPLWLEEGVAASNERDSAVRYAAMSKDLLLNGKLPAVGQLENMTYGTMAPEVFYPEAATLVTYLLERRGTRSDFVELCRQLRDGVSFSEALRKVYKIRDAEELNRGFAAYLKER